MRYQRIHAGVFQARPNRFIAHVELSGKTEICHVKNTGRCRELLVPGAAVYLEEAQNPARKTRFDLIAVQKGERLINMDAQAPNKVFQEWAEEGNFQKSLTLLKPETTFGASRFDFYWEAGPISGFVEVKGVTLEQDGLALFPDAPTERGVKHLRGLRRAVERGYRAAVFFVVQMKGPRLFRPNDDTHPAFGQALREAAAAGVGVYAWDCAVTPESLTLDAPVEVAL